MKWFFFLVICPQISLDYCEPITNEYRYETREKCEKVMKYVAEQYSGNEYIVMQAICQQEKAPSKDKGGEEKTE